MSWEDDDFDVKLPVSNNAAAAKPVSLATWEDDADEVDEALVQATAANSASGPAAPEKLKTKHVEKAKAKEREAKAAAERAASAAAEEDKPLEDPVAEAKRRERLQLAADMALAREALGGGPSTAGGAGSASSSGGGGALPGDVDLLVAAMTLTSKEHFTQLAQKTVARVLEAGGNKSTFLVQYVREVLNAAAEKLSVDELKALSTVTDAARNAKLEAAKAEQKKKKAPAKKPTKLAMEKDTDYDYDQYDDGDLGSSAAAGRGNSGNVAMSLAASGLGAGGAGSGGAAAAEAGAGEGGAEGKFERIKFKAEDDFM